jgi:hypothetical protein
MMSLSYSNYFAPFVEPAFSQEPVTHPYPQRVKSFEYHLIYCLIKDVEDSLCGLVVRVPSYRSGGSGFDSRALQEK